MDRAGESAADESSGENVTDEEFADEISKFEPYLITNSPEPTENDDGELLVTSSPKVEEKGRTKDEKFLKPVSTFAKLARVRETLIEDTPSNTVAKPTIVEAKKTTSAGSTESLDKVLTPDLEEELPPLNSSNEKTPFKSAVVSKGMPSSRTSEKKALKSSAKELFKRTWRPSVPRGPPRVHIQTKNPKQYFGASNYKIHEKDHKNTEFFTSGGNSSRQGLPKKPRYCFEYLIKLRNVK
ncbi:unnamed protein product [Strongylus vulgaris]|uniref:Uncharacterized protein n=1 Tax=Strongylus vulgaris TaxID=40348 RepID=A0A3P7JBC0_STRVU|nr:unnamed protein product [Strongylus vulgaris]